MLIAAGCGKDEAAKDKEGTASGTAPAAGSAAVPSKDGPPTVMITGGKVTLNGVEVGAKPMLVDIEKIFGKADRTWEGNGQGNRVYTWDKIGMVVYEPRDGRCISTTFPFKPMMSEFSPKNMFTGVLKVDGEAITRANDIASLKTRNGVTQPYGAESLIFDKGEIHVFTSGKAGDTLELVEVSYWQKPKPPTPLYAGSYKTSEGAMTLKQAKMDPTSVYGTYAKGSIKCKAEADQLDCKWVESSSSGRAKFKRADNGNMTGTWGSGNASSGGGGWTCTLLTAGALE